GLIYQRASCGTQIPAKYCLGFRLLKMEASCELQESARFPKEQTGLLEAVVPRSRDNIEIGLLTGCRDKPYVYGLVMALLSKEIYLDLIGSDEVDSHEFHGTPKLNFLDFGGRKQQSERLRKKLFRLTTYYIRLIRYATVA